MAERLGLPFPVLSDECSSSPALRLPTFETSGMTLHEAHDARHRRGPVTHVFYPVFPPDAHAAEVLSWLRA